MGTSHGEIGPRPPSVGLGSTRGLPKLGLPRLVPGKAGAEGEETVLILLPRSPLLFPCRHPGWGGVQWGYVLRGSASVSCGLGSTEAPLGWNPQPYSNKAALQHCKSRRRCWGECGPMGARHTSCERNKHEQNAGQETQEAAERGEQGGVRLALSS